ncbi:MAG: prepilin-type N-terminal cleavage/methylation domain-containing protein [Actinobacteria bacterium]|nr:prepilin-type N-terminal cleavage/methylation domain-containing protein [Actinomycetota bacterium]
MSDKHFVVEQLRQRLKTATDDSGFTIIELLVATAMMVVVCGAAVLMLTSVMRQTPKVTNRADQISFARNAIEQITREVRQGREATSTGSSQMTLKTFCTTGAGAASECTVSYSCAVESGKTTYACSRTVGGITTKVVGGLASAEVFCFYPNAESKECGKASPTALPRYVGLQVRFPQQTSAETQTVLEGGAALHNSTALLTR